MGNIAACLRFDGRSMDEHLIHRVAQVNGYPATYSWSSLNQERTVGLYDSEQSVGIPDESRPKNGSPHWFVGDVRLDNRAELLNGLSLLSLPTICDGEIILRAFQQWGTDSFKKLIGDFAFVIWDGRKQLLYSVRDALGQRPFFYRIHGSHFVGASTIRQIATVEQSRFQFNEVAVAKYLAGCGLEADETLFSGVRRLPAGHWLEIDLYGRLRVNSYWDLASIPVQKQWRLEDASESFRDTFTQSVCSRLRTPSSVVGVHVSGGVDSTAVLATADRINRENSLGLRFVGFSNVAARPEANERSYMDLVYKHHSIPRVENASEDFWAFKEVGLNYPRDEPFLPQYLSRLNAELEVARQQGISLILSGVGGDEVGGSSWYLWSLLMSGRLSKLLPELRARAEGRGMSPLGLLHGLARGLARHVLSSQCPRPAPWTISHFGKRREGIRSQKHGKTFWDIARQDLYHRLSYCQKEPGMLAALPILAHHRIEMRNPFLDRRIFEWTMSVPPALFGNQGLVKYPIRQALSKWLPPEIALRGDKGSYRYYLDYGLRDRERSRITKMLQQPRLAELGFADGEILRQHYAAYCNGAPIHLGQLWNALSMEDWLREGLVATW
jgi:asparagine synthase (glutamine-hydrolysing)